MATGSAEEPSSGKSFVSRLHSCCHINKKLLLLKAHFFLFFGSIAGVIPPLVLYSRQLGMSLSMVGLLFAVLPFIQFLAKFAGGALADKFRIHKTVFVACLVIMAASYFSMNFIRKQDDYDRPVSSIIPPPEKSVSADKQFTGNRSAYGGRTTFWSHTPVYFGCPESGPPRRLSTSTPAANSTLVFCPEYEDETIPAAPFRCHLVCDRDELHRRGNLPEFMCGRVHDTRSNCFALLDQVLAGRNLFSVVASVSDHDYITVPYNSMEAAGGSVAKRRDDPNANLRLCLTYRRSSELLTSLVHSSFARLDPKCSDAYAGGALAQCTTVGCQVDFGLNGTDDPMFHWNGSEPVFPDLVVEIAPEAPAPILSILWLWVGCIVGWSSYGIVLSTSDAILLATLGEASQLDFGYTRLFSSIGWGLISPIAGYLIDYASAGQTQMDYRPGFYVFIALALTNIAVAIPMKVTISEKPKNLARSVLLVFCRPQVALFALAVLVEGMITGLLWTFFVVYAKDLKGTQLIIGLNYAVECFLSEIPFFLLSGWMVKMLGHAYSISLALFVSGLKALLYSFINNPWFLLPIGLMHGIMYGVFYSTLATYANQIAPPGASATLQGIFQGLFEGLGVGIGCLIGGTAYQELGGKWTFRLFGLSVIGFSAVYAIVNLIFTKCIHRECWSSGETNNDKGDLEMKNEEQNT